MKESVTKFDLEAAFKALDELEIPVAEKGIAANRVNLKETFNKKLKTEALLEDYYDVNDTNDLEQASEERQAEIAQAKLARIEKIVDLDAETEEDILPSYEGKVIVQCPQCMTLFYKNPEDVEASEDDDTIVNVGEVCQHCGNESGYTVIGKVAAIEPEVEEAEAEKPDDLNLDFEKSAEEAEEEEKVEDEEQTKEEVSTEEETPELDLEPIEEEPEEEEKKEEALDAIAKTMLTEADEKEVKNTKEPTSSATDKFLNEDITTEDNLSNEEIRKGLKSRTLEINDKLISNKNKELDIKDKINLENALINLIDCSVATQDTKVEYVDDKVYKIIDTGSVLPAAKKETVHPVEDLNKYFGIMDTLETIDDIDTAIDEIDWIEDLSKIANIINVDVKDLIIEKNEIALQETKKNKDESSAPELLNKKESEDALEVLKDKVDIHGEDDTVVIAEKGQLDNEEAPKIEVEVSEEEFDTLEKEFHEDEPAEDVVTEQEEATEIEIPKEEVMIEPENNIEEEVKKDQLKESVETSATEEVKEEIVEKSIEEALSDNMDRFEMQDFLENALGVEETLEALVRAMSEDQMKDLFDYIVRMYDLESENLDEAITMDNAKQQDRFIFQKDGNSEHEPDFMHLAKRYVDYKLNKENADEMSQPVKLAEKILDQYKLVRYYFISVLFKWAELRQALSDRLAYFKYNNEQIKKIWDFILSKKAEWSTDYDDAVAYIKKALNDAKANKVTRAKTEEETSKDTNIEEALIIKEDVSDSEFEELINSKEYKEPISVEEVKAYWGESLHKSVTESLKNIEHISENDLSQAIKESLQQVYENVQDFKVKDCSLIHNKFTVEGLITFVSGNTRPTTYVFTEATVNNKNKEKIMLEGYNDTLDPNGKFYLEGYLLNKKSNLIPEKLTYSYHINGMLVEKLN